MFRHVSGRLIARKILRNDMLRHVSGRWNAHKILKNDFPHVSGRLNARKILPNYLPRMFFGRLDDRNFSKVKMVRMFL